MQGGIGFLASVQWRVMLPGRGGGEEKPAMDTLPGHFIRYISTAPGQLIESLEDTLGSEFGRVSVFRNAFLRILVVNIGYCRWLSVVSSRSAHYDRQHFFVSFFVWFFAPGCCHVANCANKQ